MVRFGLVSILNLHLGLVGKLAHTVVQMHGTATSESQMNLRRILLNLEVCSQGSPPGSGPSRGPTSAASTCNFWLCMLVLCLLPIISNPTFSARAMILMGTPWP
ncbi:hypothetical protein FB446DRAFT_746376 [Lentinula raphanica]|nr:hypothetical protein FB446DRAFT_746376 [Lentinula raphanica]